MTEQHPISPPNELVQQWLGAYFGATVTGEVSDVELALATQAARWGADRQLQWDVVQINTAWQRGADAELEACCEWVSENVYQNHPFSSHELRTARRPKPLSLRTRVKEIIDCLVEGDCLDDDDAITLRLALEQLND